MDINLASEKKVQALLDSQSPENIELAFSLLQNLNLSEDFARYIALHFPIQCLEYELALEEIAKIEELNSAFSKITYLPDNLKHFKQLKRWELECNRIKEIPSAIGDLKNLEYISFFDCDPAVEAIDPAIGQLQMLEDLSLGGNQLKSIPDTLFSCKALKCLDLRDNPIEELSEKIAQLEKLEWLDLSFMDLKKLPKGLSKLTKLKGLLLDGFKNPESLDIISSLKNLERLSLNKCGLKSFPLFLTELTKLKRLDLDDNFIQKIPESIKNLQSLEIITIYKLPHKEAEKIQKLLPSTQLYYNEYPESSIIYSDGK